MVAWVLNEAIGRCECCSKDASFIRIDRGPYLEVHHLESSADGETDRVSNAITLCPNCHRELHFGIPPEDLLSAAFARIPPLKDE